MKRHTILCLSASLLLLAACSKEEQSPEFSVEGCACTDLDCFGKVVKKARDLQNNPGASEAKVTDATKELNKLYACRPKIEMILFRKNLADAVAAKAWAKALRYCYAWGNEDPNRKSDADACEALWQEEAAMAAAWQRQKADSDELYDRNRLFLDCKGKKSAAKVQACDRVIGAALTSKVANLEQYRDSGDKELIADYNLCGDENQMAKILGWDEGKLAELKTLCQEVNVAFNLAILEKNSREGEPRGCWQHEKTIGELDPARKWTATAKQRWDAVCKKK